MTAFAGAIPAWALSALLRPLPRTVRPVQDETLQSYLQRLARANSLDSRHFTEYLKGSRNLSAPIPPEAVFTLSGRPPASLRYSILELCSADELAAMRVAGRPRPGTAREGPSAARAPAPVASVTP